MELRPSKMICEIHLPENRDEHRANFVVAYGDSGGADHFSSDKDRGNGNSTFIRNFYKHLE